MSKSLFKSKTFWTGVTTIIGCVASVATGAVPLATGIQTGVTAILAIFLRDGIAKSSK